jgi:hypothetical protein
MYQLIIYRVEKDAVNLDYQDIKSILFSNLENLQKYIDHYILTFIDSDFNRLNELQDKHNLSVKLKFSLTQEERKNQDYINKLFTILNRGYHLPTQIEFKVTEVDN